MAKIGYIRVSTNDQNSDLQRNALIGANCEKIFEDKISGKTANRPGLTQALKHLKPGDTLVVWKLDRLGRSVKNLIALNERLTHANVHFQSLTDSIDTSTPMGRFFFYVMSALAEMERELIIERTNAGLAAARAQGRIGGRPVALSEENYRLACQWLSEGRTRRDIASLFSVSLSTIYKYLPVGTAANDEVF
ncbi:recombinase family protein [Xenorhabdus szentirmaii]|uniref:recombinase family protein n=1 Tax=Xenorhabdus szentirmaii TaxID=290112 RepID=UPI0019B090B2|nr:MULTISPECIES: recombinase family protein [unclassified Xenorhabdus]MBD2806570.1 recombinase family protein [Xenorhabdus sp. ZM]MBD2825590.1 recombinase family protein [Xenorhabdus sp. 5]